MALFNEAEGLSSGDDIDSEGYETEFSSVGDTSEFNPFPKSLSRGFERLLRPRPAAGKLRFEWSCKCGDEDFYQDFEDAEALQAFKHQIGKLNGDPNFAHTTIDDGIHSVLKNTEPSERGATGIPSSSSGPPTTQSTTLGIYLLLCLQDPRGTPKLIQIDLRSIKSDQQLFHKIRGVYQTTGVRGYFSVFMKPAKLQYIKFRSSHNFSAVQIVSIDSYTPDGEFLAGNYQSDQLSTRWPPIRSEYFLHFLKYPSHAIKTDFCLRVLPKYSRSHILRGGDSKSQDHVAWGIQIVDGWNYGSIMLLILVLTFAVASVVAFRTDMRMVDLVAISLAATTSILTLLTSYLDLIIAKVQDFYRVLPNNPSSHSQGSTRAWMKDTRTLSHANKIKLMVEDWTAETWDWWPFSPPIRQQRMDNEATGTGQLKWHCTCGRTHWYDAKSSLTATTNSMRHPGPAFKNSQPLTSSSSPSSCREPIQMGSEDASSVTTSNRDSYTTLSESGDTNIAEMDSDDKPQGEDMAITIVPQNQMDGFVLFAVYGGRRLRKGHLRLAQIDTKKYSDDDSFFAEMAVQYKKLRGFFRWHFSIWKFQACSFIMIYKTNPLEIWPGPEELPPKTDQNYLFEQGRNPPIHDQVFNRNFYGCGPACIKSCLDVLKVFHECEGRNHCGHFEVLKYIPKRKTQWSYGLHEETREAWGLQATFCLSLMKVTLYHLLILAGPAVFWGYWLRERPTDWQNASVPFGTTITLLSVFWLPIWEKSKAKRERELNSKKNG